MGQHTHPRLDRLQIVSVGNLRDPSTTQFRFIAEGGPTSSWRPLLVKIEACGVRHMNTIGCNHISGTRICRRFIRSSFAGFWICAQCHSCVYLSGYRQTKRLKGRFLSLWHYWHLEKGVSLLVNLAVREISPFRKPCIALRRHWSSTNRRRR